LPHQIKDGAERGALHVARVLAMSLDSEFSRDFSGGNEDRGCEPRKRANICPDIAPHWLKRTFRRAIASAGL